MEEAVIVIRFQHRKSYTKHSALKTFANGIIRSGDVYGGTGVLNMQQSKNIVRKYDDRNELAQDWINIGEDISKSMKKYEHESTHQ